MAPPVKSHPVPVPPAEAPDPTLRTARWRLHARRTSDVLGVAWIHGAMHAASFRRQNQLKAWTATEPVRSLDDFAAALDEAIDTMEFKGTEVFLILAHDEFIHQTENAPMFSDAAARTYLRGRVERIEKESQPMLWVSQRAAAMKRDATHIVHLLPVTFYNRLNEILLGRRLDLTRILPLHVPLQLALSTLTETTDMPLVVASEAGSATAVLCGRTGGDVLFCRTILESWHRDPARVAVEINRSILYTKQQFGANVDFVWMLGENLADPEQELKKRCGAGTDIVTEGTGLPDWLRAVARLSHRHPVNLVRGFLQRKRRNRFFRRVVMAACWLGLCLLGFDTWQAEQNWQSEEGRLQALQAQSDAMNAEHTALVARNAAAERDRTLIHAVETAALPPVPEKTLTYVAGLLPREARLTEYVVKWNAENGIWEFRLSGTLQADEETAGLILNALQRQLATGPLRARVVNTVQAPATITTPGTLSARPFTLEGGFFEN